MTGLAPSPDFWKMTELFRDPEAVINPAMGVEKVSVWPAATLNIMPPGPAPWLFRVDMAISIEGKSPGMVLNPDICPDAIWRTDKYSSNRTCFFMIIGFLAFKTGKRHSQQVD